jgi:prepilin-type N-terminal cleavage/methylation domain-containing protein
MKHNRKPLNKYGFTLVELLIVIVVMGIITLPIATFVTTWLNAADIAQGRSNLLSNAESSMTTITTDIQLSGSAEENNRWPDPNGPGGNQYGWSSSSSVLVLARIATDKGGNVIFSDTSKYISQKDDAIYFLSGTTLYRRLITSNSSNDSIETTCPPALATATCPADLVVATGVSSFSLAYYDINGAISTTANARSVQISLTLASKVDNHNISASYVSRMVFRNE